MRTKWLIFLFIVSLMYFLLIYLLNYISWVGNWSDESIVQAYPKFAESIVILSRYTKGLFFFSTIIFVAITLYCLYRLVKTQKFLKFYIFIGVIIIFLIEIALRIYGFNPGYKGYPRFFSKVDELVEFEEYLWDDYGIIHFSKTHTDLINKLVLKTQNLSNNLDLQKEFLNEKNTFDYCSQLILQYFGRLYNDEMNSYEFRSYINQLKNKDDLDDIDSAVLKYSYNPINNLGFKSIDFKKYQSAKQKILLIGDSFTYGMSAHPVFVSFSDLLLTKGYAVFNPSFPTNDPENYLQIVRKFIDVVNPDFVVVNFYMGNDIMYSDRKTIPYQKHMYPTNAGWIYGEVNGEYFKNAQEAYEYFIGKLYINRESLCGKLFSTTVLSTIAWMLTERFFPHIFYSDVNNPKYNNASKPRPELSEQRLLEIEKICNEKGAKYILSIIPDVPEMNKSVANFNPYEIFSQQKVHLIKNVYKKDYVLKKTDGHFNNEGHRKYAEFLDSILVEMRKN